MRRLKSVIVNLGSCPHCGTPLVDVVTWRSFSADGVAYLATVCPQHSETVYRAILLAPRFMAAKNGDVIHLAYE